MGNRSWATAEPGIGFCFGGRPCLGLGSLSGVAANASSRSFCWRWATKALTGSCHSRVAPASAIISTPLTIRTEATKRRTAFIVRSVVVVAAAGGRWA